MSNKIANMAPFNVDLLLPTSADLRGVPQVKVLDIFDGFSKNFHPHGLFSVESFGKVGEERRNRMLGFIDLHVEVLHPVIYKTIVDLKGLYGEILSGKTYAEFDKETKDFVKSDALTGETGYSFFIRHLKDLRFEERTSDKRDFGIRLINKYRDTPTFKYLIVMPPGLRDYTIDDNGKPSEDEVNSLYRKIMSVSGPIENVNAKNNEEYLDNARYAVQKAVNDIYFYITNLLEGKSKLILGKWAARKVINSTRNVITSYIPVANELFGPRSVSEDQVVVGLYQYLRNILPLAVKQIRDTHLSEVFVGPNAPAVLVNPKTLKKEIVHLDPSHYDEWMTYEGLEATMARFGEEALRHYPIEIEGRYIGLLYRDDKFFKFVQDKDDLPDGFDPAKLKPITFAELLYISTYKDSEKVPAFVTRYPVSGFGSIYPCYIYLKTTIKSHVLQELDANWQPSGNVAQEFPVAGDQFYNSMSVSISNLARLAADHDGDLCSLICVLTDEAQEEVRELLNSRDYHVAVNGKMAFSSANDIIDLVMINTTA
jgi:hypothetical protein